MSGFISVLPRIFPLISFVDVLPDPPDGAPVIESITGKIVTLSWKKPKRLDPSIGNVSTHLHSYGCALLFYFAVVPL